MVHFTIFMVKLLQSQRYNVGQVKWFTMSGGRIIVLCSSNILHTIILRVHALHLYLHTSVEKVLQL